MLEKQIQSDILVAMKNSDKFKATVLRMLKSAVLLEKTSGKKELTDDDIIMIIKKQIKQRNDSISEYEKYGREDTVNDLKNEIAILESYLPKQLSSEEIATAVDELLKDFPNPTMKDMGAIMKSASSKLGKVADMSLVSQLIRAKLS
ncbi:MAG: GatB/YqeY domain-containing protein [bacterium]|nr:GatB/YqeY domain-containing protein [bacterium]